MKIGAYEVLGELGRGGSGVVHRARAPDGRPVAIKLLLNAGPGAVARFRREARIQGALGEAEGFVPLLDAGEAGGHPFLVMPFVPGGTLRDRLARGGALGVEETLALGRGLAEALGRAHATGVVHRDLKPENVLFDAAGRPLISDLGLAKDLESAEGLSRTGTFLGTAGYVAPEQVNDARAAGPPADVFALAAILYECLAGVPPFRGATVVEVLAATATSSCEPLRRRAPSAPAWLEAALGRALAHDPARRPADGSALRAALEPPLARRGSVAGVVVLLAGAGVAAALALRPAPAPPPPPAVPTPTARELLHKGEHARAAAEATRAIAARPDDADAWIVRGSARIKLGEARAALADLERALQLAPRSAEAWTRRAVARGELGDLEGAIADSTRAIELDGREATAFVCRGAARGRRGDRAGALEDLQRATELDPSNALAWLNRALACLESGEHEAALAAATRGIELAPQSPDGWHVRSACRAALGDLEGARDDASRLCELDPRRMVAWRSRAFVRHRLGDLDGAIADFTKALELDPRAADVWALRGRAHGAKGDRARELADYDRALELRPEDHETRIQRAFAREAAGDRARAIEDMEAYLEGFPDSSNADSIRQKIAELRGS